jgi:integrase
MAAKRDRRDGVWLDPRNEVWRYRVWAHAQDGRRVRICGRAPVQDNTRRGAIEAKHEHLVRMKNPMPVIAPASAEPAEREVPTVREFREAFLGIPTKYDKASGRETRRAIYDNHLVTAFGNVRLDAIDYAAVQDFTVALVRARPRPSDKSINNRLSILHRLLAVARDRGLIDRVPKFDWRAVTQDDPDFLGFDEAERLVAGADGEWRTMILVGLRTGLRQGELLGLRWEDVDLVAGKLRVRQSIVRGVVDRPKSGKGREVPLSNETVAALKAHRHLRGELVFCDLDGDSLTKGACKWRDAVQLLDSDKMGNRWATERARGGADGASA